MIFTILENPVGRSESTFMSVLRALTDSGGQLTVTEAARLAGVSVSRFSHAFKQVHGVSFRTAKINVKLQLAARLLLESDLRISQIAYKIGYSELSKFEVAFRKQFEMSPRSYRNGNSR